nr:phage tail protein [Planomicrobium sp. YIM 101495]
MIGHRREGIYGGTRTLQQFASHVFTGTGWVFSSDVIGSALIPNYGEGNVIKLVQDLCAAFECEFKIMPGNRVHFSKQIGGDHDTQYRYKHNIRALSKSVDASNLRTWITGYGANGLKVTYVSPLADIYGTQNREAEPVRDERYTIPASLTERIKRELQDYPDISYELDALELKDRDLGERVWLIYEGMELKFKTRIYAKKTIIRNGKWVTKSITLGNAKQKTLQDILIEQKVKIDENDKQNQTKFEQTNERITQEAERLDGEIVEAYASWIVEADGIRGEVLANKTYTDEKLGEVREEASTNFDILAGQVTTAVQTTKSYTDAEVGKVQNTATANFNILSGRISSKAENTTVTALGTKITTVEQDLDAVSGTLTQKVSYTDYTGANIINRIELAPAGALISATKIELEGIVRVADRVEFGRANNGQLKGLSFNNGRATVYSQGDSITLSASYIIAGGLLEARHPSFGNDMPVLTGTSLNQRLALGIDGNFLNVYDGNGTRRRLQFI